MLVGKALSKGDLWEEYSINLHGAYEAMRSAFRQSTLTQDAIAESLDADKSLISRRLNGSENLTFKTLSFMASAMGCRLTVLFTPYKDVRKRSADGVTFRTDDTAEVSDPIGPLSKAA
jgi:transcriptional regulator with XRE-family HTH domain